MPRVRDRPRIVYIKITGFIRRNWDRVRRREWKAIEEYYARSLQKGFDRYRPLVTHPAILNTIPLGKVRILDAGCGEGSLLRYIARMRPEVKLYGIDESRFFIKNAEEYQAEAPRRIYYVRADMRAIPFSPAFFDIIISHHAINHLIDPENALKEFWRVLKPGGSISLLMQHMNYEHEKRYLPGEPISIHYLQEEIIRVKAFLFGGKKSPGRYSRKHQSRSLWDNQIYEAGFELLPCEEPHPPLEKIREDPWLRKHFATPRFIILLARKALTLLRADDMN